MKTTILIVEEPDDITVNVEQEVPITIAFSSIYQVTSGGGGGGNKRIFNFVDADLSVSGQITFFHNLDSQYVDYSVFMPGIGEVSPDIDSYAYNALTISLKTFRPLVGTWTILIEGN